MTKHSVLPRFASAGLVLAGLAAVSLLSGCASSSGAGSGRTGSDDGSSSASLVSAVGTWGEVRARSPYLTFDAASGVSGNDGCNSLASTFEVEGDTVTFGRTTSTMMACIGVDSWLSALSTAVIDGDQLIVKNENGDTIGTLTKSA